MNRPFRVLALLCGFTFLLAACAVPPVPTSAPTAQASNPAPTAPAPTEGPAQSEVVPSAAAFSDPFAYCEAVGTIDQPDSRYTGPQAPQGVVEGIQRAMGIAPEAQKDMPLAGLFWRCMDGKVVACLVGANLPCESKANTDKTPTQAESDFCKSEPNTDFIPAYISGHDTIYAWACKEGQAVAGQQVFQVDPQGYIQEIWYPIELK